MDNFACAFIVPLGSGIYTGYPTFIKNVAHYGQSMTSKMDTSRIEGNASRGKF